MSDNIIKREWRETPPPKLIQQQMHVYNGEWMPQMDRCWNSNDGLQVTSRLLITPWGKVEHAAIIQLRKGKNQFSVNGEREIPWRVKQEIKNELFGENRIAIEVFPKKKNLVDVMDVYHLWIFPKDFELPFGIHPNDKKCKVVNRGIPNDYTNLVLNFQWAAECIGREEK